MNLQQGPRWQLLPVYMLFIERWVTTLLAQNFGRYVSDFPNMDGSQETQENIFRMISTYYSILIVLNSNFLVYKYMDFGIFRSIPLLSF